MKQYHCGYLILLLTFSSPNVSYAQYRERWSLPLCSQYGVYTQMYGATLQEVAKRCADFMTKEFKSYGIVKNCIYDIVEKRWHPDYYRRYDDTLYTVVYGAAFKLALSPSNLNCPGPATLEWDDVADTGHSQGVRDAGKFVCAPNEKFVEEKRTCVPVIDKAPDPEPKSCPNSPQSDFRGNPIIPSQGVKQQSVTLGNWLGEQYTLQYNSRALLGLQAGNFAYSIEQLPGAGSHWLSNWQQSRTLAQSNLQVVNAAHDGLLLFKNTSGSIYPSATPGDDAAIRTLSGHYLWTDTSRGRLVQFNDSSIRTASPAIIQRSDGYQITATSATLALRSSNYPQPAAQYEDSFGRKLALAYERVPLAAGVIADVTEWRLASMTDPSGQNITFSYGPSRILGSSTDPINIGGMLSQITWPDGTSQQFLYELPEHPELLTGWIDELGQRIGTYTYSNSGYAVGTTGPEGSNMFSATFATPPERKVTEWYDSAAGVIWRQIAYVAPAGYQLKHPNGTDNSIETALVNGAIRIVRQSQAAGSGCSASAASYQYDAVGNISGMDDFGGVRSCYAHDQARSLETERVEGLGNNLACDTVIGAAKVVPTGARKISTQWHPVWHKVTKLAEPLKMTTYIYNGQPDPTTGSTAVCAPSSAKLLDGSPIAVLCKRVEQATGDVNGSAGFAASPQGAPRIWTYTYNQFGRVLTSNGPRTEVADTSTYTYYDVSDPDLGKRGNLASVTNALGQVTQLTGYDANGNLLSLVDANGVQTTLTYDLRGRLTSKRVGDEVTGYTYDPVGQLTQVMLPDGSLTRYTYDSAHRLVGIADALGNQMTYTLDAMGNRIKEEVKDPSGQLARTRSRIYDALNRLAQDVGARGQSTRYEYDPNGNRTKVTDPLNQSTVSSYDTLNRLIQVTDPGQGQTRYSYDGQDRLNSVTDARNLATRYSVDGLGNRISQSSPDTGTSSSTYDEAGNETSRIDAKGQQTRSTYDALNRPLRITYADGSATQYRWDLGALGIGRLSQIDEYGTDGNLQRSLQRRYDAQGRVIAESRTQGGQTHTTGYEYRAGLLSRLTLPSGKQVSYSRNAAGQVSQIQVTSEGQTRTVARDLIYYPFGGLQSYTDGAGQTHRRAQDLDGQTSSYTLGSNNWLVIYDDAGRITGQMDTGNAANSGLYNYDALDRVINATLPQTSYGYRYDAVGNRTQQLMGSSSRTYSMASNSNQVSTLSNPSQTLSYDANGSLISDGLVQYAYDVRGRLIQSQGSGGTTQYQINALGQRTGKRTPQGEITYHYDLSGHLIGESDASGRVKREYLWLGDTPVAVLQ